MWYFEGGARDVVRICSAQKKDVGRVVAFGAVYESGWLGAGKPQVEVGVLDDRHAVCAQEGANAVVRVLLLG